MNNLCVFSPDKERAYRYSLIHRWDDLIPERRICWIGLNPSTADERELDPTLRRIKAFSTAWGFNCFEMTNLFGFRATDPRKMMKARDPVGPLNNMALILAASRAECVMAVWGVDGGHGGRAREVLDQVLPRRLLHCLVKTKAGHPGHPLYLAADLGRTIFRPGEGMPPLGACYGDSTGDLRHL